MVRKVTIARFEEWKADPANVEDFFRLIVEERLRFRDACVALKLPYTLMYPFIHDGGELKKRYDEALKTVSHDFVEESVEVAKRAHEKKNITPAQVMATKLYSDTLRGVAGKWDRDRYGEQADAVRTTPVVIQIANLRGPALELQPTRDALPAPQEES